MKIIIINGTSCSGKTSIIKKIMKDNDNLFHLNQDSLKWSFSKYSSEKHHGDVHKIMLAVAGAVFKIEYDIICDSGLYKEERQNLIDLAKQNNYEVVEINLEADFDVLLNRFNERVESALKVPEKDRRISNLSVDRFKELFDIFNKNKNPLAITFRTDKETPEEIVEHVKKYFN